MKSLLKYFDDYPAQIAPFMHEQYAKFREEQPLKKIKVIHHVPLVKNTLLKIACLVAAGADVIVTNPRFLAPHIDAIAALDWYRTFFRVGSWRSPEAGIAYLEWAAGLKNDGDWIDKNDPDFGEPTGRH